MARVLKRPQVLADLNEQGNFIANDSLEAALRFFDAAEATFAFLAENSLIGRACSFERTDLAGIRRWRIKGFENHLIFYRLSEDGVDIIRVLHGARDIEKVFEEDEDP